MKSKKNQLLIVEDDPGLQSQLKWSFEEFEPVIVGDRSAAMHFIRQQRPAVVITDLGLPPDPGGNTEGFALLEEALSVDSSIKVIVVTGRAEKENGVRSIGLGAYDYYQKPIDADTLKFVVERAFKLRDLEDLNQKLIKAQAHARSEGMIGSCPQMLEISQTIEKIGSIPVTVLILGETGTGKGVLAKALHNNSDRKDHEFVTINCTSIPESLLESELFGHEKGAFTGATARKIGRIEYAHGGTLFLDEIGDMPVTLQAKILHVLQERKIIRLGGNKEIALDVRVICATHQNLEERIKAGLFREDLYYRISEVVIEVPPLRERGEDKMLLAQSFLRKFSAQHDLNVSTFSQEASLAIRTASWPGNIRELENKIKRAVVMTNKPVIGIKDLQLNAGDSEFAPELLRDVRARAESEAIIDVLIHCKSMSKAAESLGITRPTLYNLINKYELESYLPGKQNKMS